MAKKPIIPVNKKGTVPRPPAKPGMKKKGGKC